LHPKVDACSIELNLGRLRLKRIFQSFTVTCGRSWFDMWCELPLWDSALGGY
jgi:hypothetical protein